MQMMKQRYGQQVIVNLLGTSLIGSKEGEAMLSNEFQRHHKESAHANDVPHIVFDYHQECRGGNTAALSKLKARLDTCCAYFDVFHANGESVLREQRGTIRTNCLDCLDRTNCVQTFLGLEILNQQIQLISFHDKAQVQSRLEEVFRQMWVNNGNEVSKIYAGTGAIQGGSKVSAGFCLFDMVSFNFFGSYFSSWMVQDPLPEQFKIIFWIVQNKKPLIFSWSVPLWIPNLRIEHGFYYLQTFFMVIWWQFHSKERSKFIISNYFSSDSHLERTLQKVRRIHEANKYPCRSCHVQCEWWKAFPECCLQRPIIDGLAAWLT